MNPPKKVNDMKLLIFAHKLEAQAFPQENILLCGEGVRNIERKLPEALSSITEIINFGVAGALNRKLCIGKVYSVGSVKAKNQDVLNFSKGLQVLTVDTPLLTVNDEKEDLVDMELYAIVRIAINHNIPVKSFKLVSDFVGEPLDLSKIKRQSLTWSQKLFDHYSKGHA